MGQQLVVLPLPPLLCSSLSYDFAKFSGYTRRHGAPAAAGRVSARLQPHQPINRARPLVAAIWRPPRQRENLIFACFRPLPHPAVRSPPRPYAPTPWPLDCALRYQHLTVLFWPDRHRNPRLGLPSHLALSCSCARFPPPCALDQLLSAPLFLLRNLAAPAALARAPRLAALRHCAAPLPPHPRFVWSPLPRLGPRLVSPSSASFSRRTSFCPSACARVSPPRLASLQRTHPVISAPPVPPFCPRSSVPAFRPHPAPAFCLHASLCPRAAHAPHLAPARASLPHPRSGPVHAPPAACASPTAPFTLAPRTPRLARTPRPRSPLCPRARALALVHRFAPAPYPRTRALPSCPRPTLAPRTASRPTLTPPRTVSRPPSCPRPTLAHRFALAPRLASLSHPCAHAPHTPHLASRPRTAPRLAPMPRFAPAPRFTPARAPRCAPAPRFTLAPSPALTHPASLHHLASLALASRPLCAHARLTSLPQRTRLHQHR
ncbi:hypothetical protein B0H14DRAFT_3492357 [Mycena olivaceomarginata]|nr:hypothetical protein B0H14DRAFT_3492357 [Mycena olivaceomarginata]